MVGHFHLLGIPSFFLLYVCVCVLNIGKFVRVAGKIFPLSDDGEKDPSEYKQSSLFTALVLPFVKISQQCCVLVGRQCGLVEQG